MVPRQSIIDQDNYKLLQDRFQPATCRGEFIVYQFEFDSDDAFHLVIDDGTFECIEGVHAQPTVTIFHDCAATALDLLCGRQDRITAFVENRYRSDGHLIVALRLHGFFGAA